MAKASENVFPKVQFSEETAPATPSAAEVVIYAKADGKLYLKDDAGTETDLTASGAASLVSGKATRSSSDQTINDNSITAIAFDTEQWDTDTMIDVGGANPERLTVTTAGKYQILGGLYFAVDSTGTRVIYIRKNGTTIMAAQTAPSASGTVDFATCATVDDAAATDYYEILVYQNSGGNLNLTSSVRNFGALVQIST